MTIIKKAVHVSIETDDGIRASIRRGKYFFRKPGGANISRTKSEHVKCMYQKKNLSQHIILHRRPQVETSDEQQPCQNRVLFGQY
jgi:hypothetical protein